jgi:foldase protein PrsA
MAVKAGTAPDEEMNQSGNDMADQFLAEVGGDEQAFVDRYLITPAQMKDIGSKINLVDIYYNGVADSAVITDEELQAEYEANQALYEQVTVRHVLILTENMTDEQKADAKKRADDVFARLQAGEDIGALATELSEDPGSKDTNGEYTFPRGQMVAPFEDWAFAAKVGDQGIVETDYGYHVMELMAEANFEAAKPLVEESLRQQKTQTAFAELPELVESPDWVVDTAKLDALEP